MPPVDFEKLAKHAFDRIKNAMRTEATYLPKAGGIFAIKGIFDDRAEQVDADGERVISSNIFTFGIKLDDLPAAPKKGDKVRISGVTYKVINALEDGVPGVSTVLVMHKDC